MVASSKFLTLQDERFYLVMRNFIRKGSPSYTILKKGFYGEPISPDELDYCLTADPEIYQKVKTFYNFNDEIETKKVFNNIKNFLQSMMVSYEIFPVNGH